MEHPQEFEQETNKHKPDCSRLRVVRRAWSDVRLLSPIEPLVSNRALVCGAATRPHRNSRDRARPRSALSAPAVPHPAWRTRRCRGCVHLSPYAGGFCFFWCVCCVVLFVVSVFL